MPVGRSLAPFLACSLALYIGALELHASVLFAPALSSIFFLGSQVDFEPLAKVCAAAGRKAGTSVEVVGRSGIKHSFSMAVMSKDGSPELVADAAVADSEVGEVKVLGFYVKVYDVKPKMGVLCVSPKLTAGAADLAAKYGLTVLESERPTDLPAMLRQVVEKAIAS